MEADAHYARYKQHDATLVPAMIERHPFALLAASDTSRPVIARAPLTVRDGVGESGAVDFHLARANRIVPLLGDGSGLTVVVDGPRAPVSPSWYVDEFAEPGADRSRTAPTYDYVSLCVWGSLRPLDDDELVTQLADLVRVNEPHDGWRFEEIDGDTLRAWCRLIIGFRLEIEGFDLTVKTSQEQSDGDAQGIIAGLEARDIGQDRDLASLIAARVAAPEDPLGLRAPRSCPRTH